MSKDEMFWRLAERLLERPAVEEGTMMGHPCVRVAGRFVAMPELGTGNLIVKLSAARVDELIGDRTGTSFAPAGRVFREWLLVEERDADTWTELLEEAVRFALD